MKKVNGSPLDEVGIVAARILSNYKPQKIILFGSLSRGEEGEESDIDLLIVKKTRKKRPFRVKEVFEALRGLYRHYPLDAIVYTPKELKERISLGDHFIKRVLREGRVIYG